MTESKNLANNTLYISNEVQYRFELKEENEMRIETDGNVILQYHGVDLFCTDEPLLYFFRDLLSFLQALQSSSPIEPAKINRVSQLEYDGIRNFRFEYQEYYFISGNEINCFLYKIGDMAYNLEIASGSPYNDTPHELMFHTELTEDMINEWKKSLIQMKNQLEN